MEPGEVSIRSMHLAGPIGNRAGHSVFGCLKWRHSCGASEVLGATQLWVILGNGRCEVALGLCGRLESIRVY